MQILSSAATQTPAAVMTWMPGETETIFREPIPRSKSRAIKHGSVAQQTAVIALKPRVLTQGSGER